MTHFRDFSSSKEFSPKVRNVDSDAPTGMRQELIDLIFHIAEHNSPPLNDELIHRIICQSLGTHASGQPYGGFRYAAGRDISKADWPRVYDLICRIWPEFKKLGIKKIAAKPNEFIKKGPVIDYRNGVNRILSAYGVVWELTEEGRLQRYLPVQAQSLVEIAISQLAAPNFAPALTLMNAARDAFDDRPRRDRDACTNIFDSMESIAKEIFNMPNATFGSVLKHIRQTNALQNEITSVLESINTLRNRNFGHGMTTQFSLSSGEVDFTYLSCIGAIIMFANMV
jgi:hypothetical protein